MVRLPHSDGPSRPSTDNSDQLLTYPTLERHSRAWRGQQDQSDVEGVSARAPPGLSILSRRSLCNPSLAR